MVLFLTWLAWIWIAITCFIDIFRRHDIGGWHAAWVVFIIVIPFAKQALSSGSSDVKQALSQAESSCKSAVSQLPSGQAQGSLSKLCDAISSAISSAE